MWQIVANLEFVTGFAIDLQTRKPNISPRETFSKQYGFQHVTTSPYYPHANRFIERNVQTVMNIMQKCKKSGADPHLAMLCLRTTPSSALTCRAAKFQGMSIQPTSHDETNAVYSRTRGC